MDKKIVIGYTYYGDKTTQHQYPDTHVITIIQTSVCHTKVTMS